MCGFKNDKNNVLGSTVTVYKYNPDGTRKLLKDYPLEYIPAVEVQGAATTTAAPATSHAVVLVVLEPAHLCVVPAIAFWIAGTTQSPVCGFKNDRTTCSAAA